MSKFITLTRLLNDEHDETSWKRRKTTYNTAHIISFGESWLHKDTTFLSLTNHEETMIVEESPEGIMALINEGDL